MVPGTPIRIASVNTGQIEQIGIDGNQQPVMSAIHKRPVGADVVTVTVDGIVGDEHHNPAMHGGPQKAIYCYFYVHIPRWEDELGLPNELYPGSFGENLTLNGQFTEEDIATDDVFGWGDVRLRVTEYRQPCSKFQTLFQQRFGADDADVVKLMKRNGRCGFYMEVLVPGTVAVDEPLILLERQVEFRTTIASSFRGKFRDHADIA